MRVRERDPLIAANLNCVVYRWGDVGSQPHSGILKRGNHAVFCCKYNGSFYVFNYNDCADQGDLPNDGFSNGWCSRVSRPMMARRTFFPESGGEGNCYLFCVMCYEIYRNWGFESLMRYVVEDEYRERELFEMCRSFGLLKRVVRS